MGAQESLYNASELQRALQALSKDASASERAALLLTLIELHPDPAAVVQALVERISASERLTEAAKRLAATTLAGLSEAALANDWNRPEEDAAWAHLQPGK